jgi:hypothetical protein
MLSGTAILKTRRDSTKRLASKNRQKVTDAAASLGAMIWMDNFNKFRYARNVNEERDRCINGTVFAVLPLKSNDEDLWPGWQPLSTMMRNMSNAATQVMQAISSFGNEVRTLKQRPLTFDQVRVPCDVRRRGARNLGWTPWSVNGENVGSTTGMLSSVEYIMNMQRRSGKLMPILVDVNVYYRILKLLYHKDVISLNVRGAFRGHPLVFGLWHAYAHCVKRTFVIFKNLWAALEYPGFLRYPDTTSVYLKPRLDALEQMVTAMYLVHSERRVEMKSTVSQCKSDFGEDSQMHRLACSLELLLGEYIPCLFSIGLSVRECHWALQKPSTGSRARTVLSFCLGYLLALEKSHRNEYCRVISMAVVTWSPYHSGLPAAVFVEEVLEASLSRLNRFCATDLRAHSVEQFSEAYASLGCGREVVDCSRQHLAKTLPHRVLMRLDKCLDALRAGAMPTVVGGPLKGRGSRTATPLQYVPRSPLHGVQHADVARCVHHAMYTLLISKPLDAEVKTSCVQIAKHSPALGPVAVQQIEHVYREAEKRLHDALRVAPERRRSQAVIDLTEGRPADDHQIVDSASGIVIVLMFSYNHFFSIDHSEAVDGCTTTDPGGRSEESDDSEEESGAETYRTWDSRSPACTSGSEDGHVSDFSLGGMSASEYYSQV